MNPMHLAIVIVVFAAIALIYISYLWVSASLAPAGKDGLAPRIEPIDIEAFRNLLDPDEREYLRRRLPASEFRTVQRKRLLAMAAYIKTARHNAAALIQIARPALISGHPKAVEAAQQLTNNAMMLCANARYALFLVHLELAWPRSGSAATPILRGYEQLNGSAMLLGRLQSPAVPVRISA